ncbi:MAG: Na/Pi cotransporter family protein [Planctomycetes bacterium]|nr:Na/Pi cotransporter family protein [Planctomycetota bacterium]
MTRLRTTLFLLPVILAASTPALGDTVKVPLAREVYLPLPEGVNGVVISPDGEEFPCRLWQSHGRTLLSFTPDSPGVYRVQSPDTGKTLGLLDAAGTGLADFARLLGGLALFLYAMHLISRSLNKAAGAYLRPLLEKFASHRVLSAGVGAVISAALQSSTAAAVMLVGMAAAGVITLVQAVPVAVGASLGSIVTVQIIAFNLADYALFIIAAGTLIALVAPYKLWSYVGRTVLGFGLIFLGMGFMRQGIAPLEHSENTALLLLGLGNKPFLAFFAAMVFTAAVQSSAATAALLMTLVAGGSIAPPAIVAMLLGAHAGSAITPLLASIGATRTAARVALATFVYKASGALLLLPFVGLLSALPARFGWTLASPRGVANLLTCLAVFWSLGALPFTRLISRIAERLIPQKTGADRDSPLDPALLGDPASAVGAVMLAAADMTALLKKSTEEIPPALFDYSSIDLERLQNADEVIDARHRLAVDYVRETALNEMTKNEARSLGATLYILRDLEAVGDLVSKDIVPIGFKRLDADRLFAMGDMAAVRKLAAGMARSLECIEKGLRSAARTGLPVPQGDINDALQEVQDRAAGIGKVVIEAQAGHFSAMTSGVVEAKVADSVFTDAIAVLRHLYAIAGDMAGVLLNPPETGGFYHYSEKGNRQ